MAKKILSLGAVCAAILFVSTPCVSAEPIDAQSKISEVTVYPGSAHITRQVQLDLTKGEHSIVLKDIVPQLDENTLSVSGQGTAKTKIFGAYIKKEFLKETPDERVQELQTTIEELSDKILMLQHKQEILEKEKQFLHSFNFYANQQIPKELVTEMPATDEMKGILNFLSESLNGIETQKETLRLEIRSLTKEKQALEKELGQLRHGNRKMQRAIAVDLECLTPGTLTLELSYLVNGANWRPLYDARSRYDQGEVELTAYGVVRQSTGEDWADVRLTLSTAKPSIGGRMPYVSPWVLQPFEQHRRRMAKSAPAMMMDKLQVAGAVQYEAMELDGVMAEKEEAKMDYAEVSSKGVSVVYNINKAATIKSDGTDNKFPIVTQTLKADFEYSSYPRLKPFAYLGSRVVNSDELQLLAGQVNLFLDGAFVGKSTIDNIGPGQDFDLYLGVDESVKVERREISRKMDDVLIAGIPSPNKKITLTYRLKVENYKPKKIKVNLFEAIPVSQNERIRVKVLKVSENPQKKDWKKRQGIWLWQFELNPKDKKEITFTLNVEYPRKMNVPGI